MASIHLHITRVRVRIGSVNLSPGSEHLSPWSVFVLPGSVSRNHDLYTDNQGQFTYVRKYRRRYGDGYSDPGGTCTDTCDRYDDLADRLMSIHCFVICTLNQMIGIESLDVVVHIVMGWEK